MKQKKMVTLVPKRKITTYFIVRMNLSTNLEDHNNQRWQLKSNCNNIKGPDRPRTPRSLKVKGYQIKI